MNLVELKTIADTLPDAVKTNALLLLEEMSSVVEGIGDEPVVWKPSFLKLVQGTTDRAGLPKGTGIGDFILGETKLEQPMEFIPLRLWDGRQRWDPDQNNSKMLCNSPDAKLGYIGLYCKQCPYSAWVEDAATGKGSSDCNKMKSMLAISSDLRYLFQVNFSKSSYKPGMELEGLMKKAGVAPYRRTYGLSTVTSSSAKNVELFKIDILPEAKRITPDSELAFLKGMFDIIQVDRKAMLDKFYEIALTKTEATMLALAAPESDSNLLIENSTTASDTATAEAGTTEKATSASSMGKGYKV